MRCTNCHAQLKLEEVFTLTHLLSYLTYSLILKKVWTNCYHAYPAGAPFGGRKSSGFGRENHKMMLNHYRHVKNILISYDKNKLGFF